MKERYLITMAIEMEVEAEDIIEAERIVKENVKIKYGPDIVKADCEITEYGFIDEEE